VKVWALPAGLAGGGAQFLGRIAFFGASYFLN